MGLHFKNKLLGANTTNGDACIGVSANICEAGIIDTNGNGEIEVAEAQAVAIYMLMGLISVI